MKLKPWMIGLALPLFLNTTLASDLPAPEAGAWLQRVADSARRLNYEGKFVFQQGDSMQTLRIVSRAVGSQRETHLFALDGAPREVICRQGESLVVTTEGGVVRTERRPSTRHFPDLLPANPTTLVNWYSVRVGEMDRVAGLECRWLILLPRDAFRWGYHLCVEKDSALPLKAVMVNDAGRPLQQYVFTEIRIGSNTRPATSARVPAPAGPAARAQAAEVIAVRQLPPGYTRIAAVKRRLPKRSYEVEQWVYSDGLTHISLFIEPAVRPVETVKGESPRGMLNLLTRQVGSWQVTVLGDAPWPAIETIATGLAER